MGSEFAGDSGYFYATPSLCWFFWTGLILLTVLAVGAFIGWWASERLAMDRRARFKAAVRSSIDKALDNALKARDEELILAARKLAAEMTRQLEPILNLSDPLLANRKAIDRAVCGKKDSADSPHTEAEPARVASGAVGVGVMAPVQIVSVSPPQSSAHDGSVEREMSISERDTAVRKAVLAFDTFWKTSDVAGLILNAQQSLSGERAS